jgi:hypothetical protein
MPGIVAAKLNPTATAWWDQTTVPPFILKTILNNTARQLLAPSWNQWLGNGILDVDAAYKILKKWF